MSADVSSPAPSGTVTHGAASRTEVSEHRVIVSIVNPAYLDQRAAAAYLGVSVRYFQLHVTVRPKELPGRGRRAVLRWSVAELEAWVNRVSDPKSRPRRAS